MNWRSLVRHSVVLALAEPLRSGLSARPAAGLQNRDLIVTLSCAKGMQHEAA
jgi:hypothetical protein